MRGNPNPNPDTVPLRAFEAALAARAERLEISAAPFEAVLAGARRRAGRRRAALAVAGVAVLAGAASGLGIALAGAPGQQKVPPGQRSSLPVEPTTKPTTKPTTIAGPRPLPHVTAQAGLAAGQTAPDRHPVVASGTTDGKPWQASVYTAPGTDQGTTCLNASLWIAGSRLILGNECTGGAVDAIHAGQSRVMIQDGGSAAQAWMFVVPEGTAEVAWIGTDGFRQEVAVIPVPEPAGLGLAVFPNTGAFHAEAGDTFVAYDATGKAIDTYLKFQPPSPNWPN